MSWPIVLNGGPPPAIQNDTTKVDTIVSLLSLFLFFIKMEKIVARFPVGQNIATTWTTKPPSTYADIDSDFPDAIRKWFNEYKLFNFGGVARGRTGHYTQVMNF